MKANKWYTGHVNALIKSGLSLKVFPSLKEVWRISDASRLINESKQENRFSGECNTHFWIGFYDIYRENIQIIIQRICGANGLNWLRTKMSYHMFPNLGDLIQGYLVSKLRMGLALKYFSIDTTNATWLRK